MSLKFVNEDTAQMIGLMNAGAPHYMGSNGIFDIANNNNANFNTYPKYGGVTEWFKEPAWNAGAGKLVEGSNPSLSAIIHLEGSVIGIDGRVPETGMP